MPNPISSPHNSHRCWEFWEAMAISWLEESTEQKFNAFLKDIKLNLCFIMACIIPLHEYTQRKTHMFRNMHIWISTSNSYLGKFRLPWEKYHTPNWMTHTVNIYFKMSWMQESLKSGCQLRCFLVMLLYRMQLSFFYFILRKWEAVIRSQSLWGLYHIPHDMSTNSVMTCLFSDTVTFQIAPVSRLHLIQHMQKTHTDSKYPLYYCDVMYV